MLDSVKDPWVYILALLLINLFVFYMYYFATKFEKEIVFKKTFYTSRFDNKKLLSLVSDVDGNVYQIQNVGPILHFTASETNARVEFKKRMRVKGYGLRIPFLGLYPNLIHVQLVL